MSAERDELTDIIASNRTEYANLTADRILAAGYSKPLTITTATELDALPREAVVRDAEGYVLERWGQPEERMWATPMNGAWIRSAEITLPATVLYAPEPQS
jgi:hypothetical protein